MPTFRTKPSSNLNAAISRMVAAGGDKLGPLGEIQATQAAASTAQHLSLAEKARAEVEQMQQAQRQRTDPAAQAQAAGDFAGITTPIAQQLAKHIRGVRERPEVEFDNGDEGFNAPEGGVANRMPDITYAKPENLPAGAERLFQSALASLQLNNLATGHTNAEQLAQATGHVQATRVAEDVQAALARGDLQAASAMNQGAKPGSQIKLFDNVGNTGATFAPATGTVNADPRKQPGNALLAGNVAEITAKTNQANAAAEKSRAEKGDQAKPPQGYRWGEPDAQGNPTLIPIAGGPAESKATSSDSEKVAAGYAARMTASAKILGALEKDGVGKPEWMEAMLSNAPVVGKPASNAAMSEVRQKYRQAQEDWVRAKLRKESGAVIADEEMDREIRTYFPMIGDKPPVIAQKAASRKTAEQSMVQAGGRAYTHAAGATQQLGNVEAEKTIGNVRFVKIGGKWYTP